MHMVRLNLARPSLPRAFANLTFLNQESEQLTQYPSTTAVHTPTADWTSGYAKAATALAQLNLTEKVGLVSGVGWSLGPCVGNTYSADKIGYPSLCLQDGPLGVRYASNVSAFPAGIQAAATWDRELMYQRGLALGKEAKGMGVHVQLGPVAGALGKIPNAGRNWEGFSPDPYLMGVGMYETVVGMQEGGVQACAKHCEYFFLCFLVTELDFMSWESVIILTGIGIDIGNEQELNRSSISANIPDRAMHELYLWPFADAVNAGVASFMCSYVSVFPPNHNIKNAELGEPWVSKKYVETNQLDCRTKTTAPTHARTTRP